ncbi:hypothetical protein CC2G_010116 [Coprinopsis cinerea AmutBmut pab1-1]|nr:hypothetical protein CC2G_010116 [Coprinopsis cinerea AmutBmut pab1-1]
MDAVYNSHICILDLGFLFLSYQYQCQRGILTLCRSPLHGFPCRGRLTMDLDLSVESVVRTKFVSNLVETSCLVLWIADYLETLPLEISVMWTSSANKFSLVKSLFYSLRYLPFAFFALGLALEDELVDERSCRRRLILFSLLTVAIVALAEALLFIRVYAIGGRSKNLRYFLVVYFVVSIGVAFALLIWHSTSLTFSQPIPGLEAYSCGFIRSVQGNLLSIAWGIVAANEILMMSMTLLFVFKKHNNYRNRILEVFYRNGTLYIMAIVAVSTGNILTAVIAPRFVYLLTSWQATLHAVFSTRMVLQIREAANGTTSAVDQETAQTHIGALEFVPLSPLSQSAHTTRKSISG